MMQYADLFVWWALVITSGIVFLTLVSVYLYIDSRKKRERNDRRSVVTRVGGNFIFIWILLSLLVLYIFSIGEVSTFYFALGNIVVEVGLLIYLLKNKVKET